MAAHCRYRGKTCQPKIASLKRRVKSGGRMEQRSGLPQPSSVSRLAEPEPAGGTVQPPPCRQCGAQPIGHDIGDLCGSLGYAGLVKFIGNAIAECGQDAIEGDLPWGTSWRLVVE